MPSGVTVLTNSLEISNTSKTVFFSAHFLSCWSKNTAKILPCWFKQCFGPLNMLAVHKCSDTGLFRHLTNSTFWWRFGKQRKNWANIFPFGDNCIWIECLRPSLLPRKNTCHRLSISKQTVWRFQILLRQNFGSWFSFKVINKYEKTTAMLI